MSKFSRKCEYSFVSLEELISEVMILFREKCNVQLVLSYQEVPDIMTALFSTGEFTPFSIDFAYPEMNDYIKEYLISLNHFDNGNMLIEPLWKDRADRYIDGDPSCVETVFISENVSEKLYDKYVRDGYYTVLFNIEN